ncbi:hypothetical protein LY78DRAFT_356905 [Colletotrichum sublineola]|nr:hypothetical protein LY78DRAFT_356905 [Colletotrichum sublineola]
MVFRPGLLGCRTVLFISCGNLTNTKNVSSSFETSQSSRNSCCYRSLDRAFCTTNYHDYWVYRVVPILYPSSPCLRSLGRRHRREAFGGIEATLGSGPHRWSLAFRPALWVPVDVDMQ